MRLLRLKLYLPFLALMMTQAALIAIVPSKAPVSDSVGTSARGGSGGGSDDFGSSAVGPDGEPIGPDGTSSGGAPGGPEGTGSGGAAGAAGGTGPGGAAGPTVSGACSAGSYPRGCDTSHCVRGVLGEMVQWRLDEGQGLQPIEGPPCAAKWPKGADNGSATYRGVTKDTINIVYWRLKQGDEEAAILKNAGLAAPAEDVRAMLQAGTEFVNAKYELYGRKINAQLVEFSCTDNACIREEARNLVKKNPFAVWYGVYIGAEVFDEWVRAGILSFGGNSFGAEFYNKRRPFRYSTQPDMDKALGMLTEYYCKKMAKKPATNSGRVIHGEIGARGQVTRRLGLVVQDEVGDIAAAERFQRAVAACEGRTPPIIRMSPDLLRAQDQSLSVTGNLVQEKVTTVVCVCSVTVLIPLTPAFTQQSYYPEILSTGVKVIDHDQVGRVFDQSQWAHFFGPSFLPVFNTRGNYSNNWFNRVWRATGRQGNACDGCGEALDMIFQVARFAQMTGPDLSPQSIDKNVVQPRRISQWGWDKFRDPHSPKFEFGPDDYTGVDDFKEGYWDRSARSGLDNKVGTFVAVRGGRRYLPGQFDSSFEIPPAPS